MSTGSIKCAGEEILRAEFEKLADMPDWGARFAPSAWGISRTTERDANAVVAGLANATLKPINCSVKNLIILILAAALLLGVGYLFRDTFMQIFAPRPQVVRIDPKIAEEYKRKIEEQRKIDAERMAAAVPPAPEPVVMPFDMLPGPAERAALCYQAAAFLMQPVSGWIQTNVECGETHANATFRRDFGTLNGFYEIATKLMPGAYVVEKSESEINARVKLPYLSRGVSRDAAGADNIVREVNTLFQRMDAAVETNVRIDPSPDGAAGGIFVVEVGAASKLIPTEFMKIFEQFSGVYMPKVAWDARSKTWNYEVIIYAK
jgi:hypothetical protein